MNRAQKLNRNAPPGAPQMTRAAAIEALHGMLQRVPPESEAHIALGKVLDGSGTEQDQLCIARATVGAAAVALCKVAQPGGDLPDDTPPSEKEYRIAQGVLEAATVRYQTALATLKRSEKVLDEAQARVDRAAGDPALEATTVEIETPPA